MIQWVLGFHIINQNKIMQAMRITSRSIDSDQFVRRQTLRNYKRHLQTIGNISTSKEHSIVTGLKQAKLVSKQFFKSKSLAKIFHEKEQKLERRRSHKTLLGKLLNVKPSFRLTQYDNKYQYVSGSHLQANKRREQLIKQQNKMLGYKFVQLYEHEFKDKKKKMHEYIEDYLERRKHARKLKDPLKPNRYAQKSIKRNTKRIYTETKDTLNQNKQSPKQTQQTIPDEIQTEK